MERPESLRGRLRGLVAAARLDGVRAGRTSGMGPCVPHFEKSNNWAPSQEAMLAQSKYHSRYFCFSQQFIFRVLFARPLRRASETRRPETIIRISYDAWLRSIGFERERPTVSRWALRHERGGSPRRISSTSATV